MSKQETIMPPEATVIWPDDNIVSLIEAYYVVSREH
jgi:hypothetical protein